jgi:hypothetical protein
MKVRVYNKTLCPDLWDENQNIKPEVYKSLLQVAKDFYKSTDLTSEPDDILILGSSVGYNWTPQSDVDIHILIDIEQERIDPETSRKFLDGLAFKWNTEHEIEVKDHKVEVYLQDINETNHSLGAYSLMDNRWLRKPCPQRVVLDKEKIQQKFTAIQKQIDSYIETEDVDKLKALMKAISSYRQAGLDRSGEFSTENVVFKALRHSGELKRLKDAISDIYDIQKSINEAWGEKYIILGYVNFEYEIISLKDTEGNMDHRHLIFPQGYDKHGLINWRYKSSDNTIFFWKKPDQRELDVIKDHLKRKYNVKNPTVEVSRSFYFSYGPGGAHNIDETFNEADTSADIWIGYTDDETLETNAVKTKGGQNHNIIPGYSAGTGKKRWRWRSDFNFVFWWTRPDEKEEEAVSLWLEKKTGVKVKGHYVPEDFGQSDEDIYTAVHNPYEPLSLPRSYKRKIREISLNKDPSHYKFSPGQDRYIHNFLMDDKNFSVVIEPASSDNVGDFRTFSPQCAHHIDNFSDHELTRVLKDYDVWIISFHRETIHTNPAGNKFLQKQYKSYGDITKKALSVYSEILGFIKFFIDKKHPGVVAFIPASEKQEQLYNKFIERFDKSFNYERIFVDNLITGHEFYPDEYVFKRKDMKLEEGKYDPFESRELWFVTYGGINPTKQKGYDPKQIGQGGMHYPPARSGFYAFVWPYVEKFLLGGSKFVDPKARGKGARNRLAYVRDKEGKIITSDHPDYERLAMKDKNWSLTRTKDNQPDDPNEPDRGDWADYKHMLYRNVNRKKFKYEGPLWHHLGQWLTPDKIWDRKGVWVKTDINAFKYALRKELSDMKKTAFQHGLSGVRGTTMDHLEVFIDQKV